MMNAQGIVKKGLTTLFITCALLASGAGSADTCRDLNNTWKEFKKNDNDPSKEWIMVGHYLGYIAGVTDSVAEMFKLPTNGTYTQYTHVVGKWLERHPEKWHEHRAVCILFAFQEAYGLRDQ